MAALHPVGQPSGPRSPGSITWRLCLSVLCSSQTSLLSSTLPAWWISSFFSSQSHAWEILKPTSVRPPQLLVGGVFISQLEPTEGRFPEATCRHSCKQVFLENIISICHTSSYSYHHYSKDIGLYQESAATSQGFKISSKVPFLLTVGRGQRLLLSAPQS